jgi:hypothetical protein
MPTRPPAESPERQAARQRARARNRRRRKKRRAHEGVWDYASPHKKRVGEARVARLKDRKRMVRRLLQAGELDLTWVLRADKEWFRDQRIGEVLNSVRYLGRRKVRWLLDQAALTPAMRVGDIGVERRERLILLIAANFGWVKLGELTDEQRELRDLRRRNNFARESRRREKRKPQVVPLRRARFRRRKRGRPRKRSTRS